MQESATSPSKIEWPEGIQPLDQFILNLVDQQITCEKTGKYVEAEQLRIKVQSSRKELDRRKENDMESRHRREKNEVERAHSEELNQFNQFWDKKAQELNDEGKRCETELENKHKSEQEATRQELERTLSIKCKESSELLNLRKMEEHMAKQKNYVEAHKVQSKITAMEKQQNESWTIARSNKIQTALNQLRNTQNNEMTALKKRIGTSRDEQNKDRQVELSRIMQKYNNVKKELHAQHEKEVITFKKMFPSKASVSSPGSSKRSN